MDLAALVTTKDEVRFWSKVVVGGLDECWPWAGCVKKRGYGRFKLRRHVVAAHRVAYYLANGALSPLDEVDHTCMTVDCVNPNHLEAVHPGENRRRRVEHYRELP